MALTAQEKKDKVTRIAQQMMELAQKIYNSYGNVNEALIPTLEDSKKLLQQVVSGMRW
jgi:hypothetical protein